MLYEFYFAPMELTFSFFITQRLRTGLQMFRSAGADEKSLTSDLNDLYDCLDFYLNDSPYTQQT